MVDAWPPVFPPAATTIGRNSASRKTWLSTVPNRIIT